MTELEMFFDETSRIVDKSLDELVPDVDTSPKRLHEAMRWSLFGGGKRFRPALVIAVGRTLGASDERLTRTAAAVEMIHTYSLVHDDLPSMDDDDLRRGRETCHKRFDEATAILAGDALQALAFQTISEDENLSADIRLRLIEELSCAAAEMVSGQQLDLEGEGADLTIEEIELIHEKKTGALIGFSARVGAIIRGADDTEFDAISNYGRKIGLLFQITDDLLDVTQTTVKLGKTAAKDLSAAKATYPALNGIEETRELAREVYREAVGSLKKIDRPTQLLEDIAEFILLRES